MHNVSLQPVIQIRELVGQNQRPFTGNSNTVRKFYLKAFAIDDHIGFSKFRQWLTSSSRYGSKRSTAEIEMRGQSITFTCVSGKSKEICSWWFPRIDTGNVRQIFLDPHSSSLKIQWNSGRTLYAQFRTRHYKSFCPILGFYYGSTLRPLSADRVRHTSNLDNWIKLIISRILPAGLQVLGDGLVPQGLEFKVQLLLFYTLKS